MQSSPNKDSGLKAQVSFPDGLYSMCIVTYWCQERNAVHDSVERGQLEAPHLELSWTWPHVCLPLADFNQGGGPCGSVSVTPVVNTKYLILFQFITHWIGASVPTVGYVRAMRPVTVGNLVKAAVPMVKVRHTISPYT